MNILKPCECCDLTKRYADLVKAEDMRDSKSEKPKTEIERQADIQARIFNAQQHQGAF